MNKREIFKTVDREIKHLCFGYELPRAFLNSLDKIISDNLAPKQAGMSIDLDEVTKVKNGKIVEIQCAVSKVFLPATKEFFYEDKQGKGILVDGVRLRRLSRQAESIRKKHAKYVEKTEREAMGEVLSGTMTPEQAKQIIEIARNKKPDYSSIG